MAPGLPGVWQAGTLFLREIPRLIREGPFASASAQNDPLDQTPRTASKNKTEAQNAEAKPKRHDHNVTATPQHSAQPYSS